ncbi:MAG: glycosyltransferase family 4 protein [Pseudomonadota bacterium]
MTILISLLLPFILSFLGTALIIPQLKRYGVIDNPNERSNHKIVTPRGGGIAIFGAIIISFLAIGIDHSIIIATTILAIVSFIDDMRGLSAFWRFLVQFIAVFLALYNLDITIFAWLPNFIQLILIALFWLWFINLTNFMDGIDGITSMQIIIMSVGVCLIISINPELPETLTLYASVLAAASLGFYWFNRSPAQVFMGDTGSITLGFLMGYILIELATSGEFFAAIILPAYYLSDATFTLLKRAWQGKKIWQSHSEHAYQQAARSGMSHKQVVDKITLLNILLILLAIIATSGPIYGFFASIAAYAMTFFFMKKRLISS